MLELPNLRLVASPLYFDTDKQRFSIKTQWMKYKTDGSSVLPYQVGDTLIIKNDFRSLKYMMVEEIGYIITHDLSPKKVAYGYDESGNDVTQSVFNLMPIVSLSKVINMDNRLQAPIKPFFREEGILWFFSGEMGTESLWVSENGERQINSDKMRIDFSNTRNREFFIPPFQEGDAVYVGKGAFRSRKIVRIRECIDSENVACSDGNIYRSSLLTHYGEARIGELYA